jgi:leucyl aminopeptidase (aminopeptidase T)
VLIVCSLTYIGTTFNKLANPTNVAVFLNDKVVASIPKVHAKLNQELPRHAEKLAKKSVQMIHKVIPMAGDMLEKQLEIRFDQVMEHYKVEREKIFENICSKVIDKIKKHKDLANDDTLAQALAVQLAEECDREAKDIVNNAFFKEIEKLQKKVEILRSIPEKKMTRQQAAKKNLIIRWIYLIDNKGIDKKSIIGNAATLIGGTAESFIATQN